MNGKYALFLATAGAVALVDQVSKFWIQKALAMHHTIPIFPGFLRLVHVRNTGAAFGMFAGSATETRTWIFAGITAVAMVIILLFLRNLGPSRKTWVFGLGLVFGGAIGNLIDRIRYGYVVDFLDLYVGRWHWPAFNAADSAVTIGAFLLMFKIFTDRQVGRHAP